MTPRCLPDNGEGIATPPRHTSPSRRGQDSPATAADCVRPRLAWLGGMQLSHHPGREPILDSPALCDPEVPAR